MAPSMRERPLDENTAAFDFAERLLAGEFDMMILLTGVGTRQLQRLFASRYSEAAFARKYVASDRGGGARPETACGASRIGCGSDAHRA